MNTPPTAPRPLRRGQALVLSALGMVLLVLMVTMTLSFGTKAKQFTSEMVFGKIVEVESIEQDRYGRTVGLVKIDGKILNEELIKAGMAWVYTQFCKRPVCREWKELETRAKTERRGLWADPHPLPPWEFRRQKRVSP